MGDVDKQMAAQPPRVGDSPKHPAAPTVIDKRAGKKKKRRYSRGWRAIQDLERGMTRSLESLTEGVARVFSEYRRRSDKSARKKRDGALRDGIENWTKAMDKGMRVASEAPQRFARSVNRGRGSKQLRDAVRALTPPPLR